MVGSGLYSECRARLVSLLNRTAVCPVKPCTFDGVHQPAIDSAPPLSQLSSSSPSSMPFYGFSELFYTSLHLFNLSGRYSYSAFSSTAQRFCALPYSAVSASWQSGLYGAVPEARLRLQCFKAAWMSVILHEGLGFQRSNDTAAPERGMREEELSGREQKKEGRRSDAGEVVPTRIQVPPQPADAGGKRRRRLLQSDERRGGGGGAAADAEAGAPLLSAATAAQPTLAPASTEADELSAASVAVPSSAGAGGAIQSSEGDRPAAAAAAAAVRSPRATHSAFLVPISTAPNSQEEVQWSLGAVLTRLSSLVEAAQPQCEDEEEEEAGEEGFTLDGSIAAPVGRSVGGGSSQLRRLLRRMSRLSAGWVLLLCGATSGVMCAAVAALWWKDLRLFAPFEGQRRRVRKSASSSRISIVLRRW